MLPALEIECQFLGDRPPVLIDQIEEDLESVGLHARQGFQEQPARRGEKARQRIAELLAEQKIGQSVAVVRQGLAEIRRQACRATARQKSRARHDVGAALHGLEHPRNQRRIVLKIAIHNDDDVALRRLDAPVDGGAQTALLYALQASDVVML